MAKAKEKCKIVSYEQCIPKIQTPKGAPSERHSKASDDQQLQDDEKDQQEEAAESEGTTIKKRLRGRGLNQVSEGPPDSEDELVQNPKRNKVGHEIFAL